MSAARRTSRETGHPARSATSFKRCEFDELGEPTTIIASTRAATAFTASWRLVVAWKISSLWGAAIPGKALAAAHRRSRACRPRRAWSAWTIGQVFRICRRKTCDILHRLHQEHGAIGQLPHRAHDLGVAGMADEDDRAPTPVMDFGLPVNLRDQRTGRVDGEELAFPASAGTGFRYAVGRKDHRCTGRGHLGQFVHEHRAFPPQPLDDVLVVHNFMTHIHRRSVDQQRLLDCVDGTHHTRAEASRRAKLHVQARLRCWQGDAHRRFRNPVFGRRRAFVWRTGSKVKQALAGLRSTDGVCRPSDASRGAGAWTGSCKGLLAPPHSIAAPPTFNVRGKA